MNFIEAIKVSWFGVTSNKLRASLTMLGIIIGVAAVIMLVSIGRGVSAQVTSQVQGLGTNLLVITPDQSKGASFTIDDAQSLLERVPSLANVVPVIPAHAKTSWGSQSYDTTINGVTPAYLPVRSRSVVQGHFFSDADVRLHARYAVLGQKVASQLFGQQDPLGQTMLINGSAFQVTGVLDAKGSSFGQDEDDLVLIPVTTAQELFHTRQVPQFYATVKDGAKAPVAVNHIQRVFDLKFHQDNSVHVLSQQQLLQVVQNITGLLTMALGAIAAISLLVGGIGIMNIMLVSVAERTREIGIRKAAGARYRDIRNQFLTEAIFLCLAGGIVGVLIGSLGAGLIGKVGGWGFQVYPGAIGLAFGFSVFTGVVFGLWPALRAAKLDPVEALRRE